MTGKFNTLPFPTGILPKYPVRDNFGQVIEAGDKVICLKDIFGASFSIGDALRVKIVTDHGLLFQGGWSYPGEYFRRVTNAEDYFTLEEDLNV